MFCVSLPRVNSMNWRDGESIAQGRFCLVESWMLFVFRISQGQLIRCQEKEQGVVLQISTFNPPLYALYALSHFADTVLRQIVNVEFWGHAFERIRQTVGLEPRPMR